MKIKLLLDEDIHLGLERALAQRGYDVKHVQSFGRKGLSDDDQLQFAHAQQRCLLSFNVKDFVMLHNQYVEQERDHSGLILSKQLPLRELLRKSLAFLQKTSTKSMKNRLEFL